MPAPPAWETPLIQMMRYIINDFDPTNQTYVDEQLKTLILYGGFLMNKDISYGQNYTFDLNQLTISPDPVINKDFAFINLSILKAACILARNQLRNQANQAVKWKDGQSSFDGTELYKAQKMVVDNIFDEFNQAWMQYQFGDTAPGNVILGPFSSDRIAYGSDQGYFFEGTPQFINSRGTSNFSSQAY